MNNYYNPVIQTIDEKIILYFQGIRWDVLTGFFKTFIPLEFWDVTAVILVLYFFFRTKIFRAPVISFFLAWNGAEYGYALLKNYFHRPRPFLTIKGAIPVITPHGFSFPSGHATMAMAMAVVLTYHFPKTRYLVFTLAILVGFSRIYFGVHYLTDVLAGFLLGAIIGLLSILGERFILSINKGVSLPPKTEGR